MKTYRECIGNSYNSLKGRETVEWTNGWIDNANKNSGKRLLLIGDSTVRMVRHALANQTGYSVDMIGTSSSVEDELFVNFIDSFFHNTIYHYDAIFVQLGHHGRIAKDGGPYSNSDFNLFERCYDSLIKFLK